MRPGNEHVRVMTGDMYEHLVYDIVHGRRSITADTALRLGKYFGTSPELWLGLQMEYDVRRAKRDMWPAVEPRIRPIQAA